MIAATPQEHICPTCGAATGSAVAFPRKGVTIRVDLREDDPPVYHHPRFGDCVAAMLGDWLL